ncbi:MAG: sigma-70 family RNA polymerase sigma factor [Pseudomonadota bacterium]
MPQADTAQLIDACRQGDVDAYTRLVTSHQRVAMHVAFGFMGDLQLAEDVVQEAFLYAWQHLDQLRDPAAFRAWLRQIVRTQSLRVLRRSDFATADQDLDQPIVDDDPVRVIGTEQFNSLLLRSVGELSESLRSAFVLYYLAEHPVSVVAEILAVKPGTVRKRLHDARQHLQDLFSHDRLHEGRVELEASMAAHEKNIADRMAALMNATVSGDNEVVGSLLDETPELAKTRGQHPIWSGEPQPLHVAAERGQLDIVRQLLDAGADVNADDAEYDGWSPLMLAAHGGRLGIHNRRESIVTLLRDRGARVDIHEAVLLDDVETVSRLLDADPALANEVGPADATPLHFVTSAAMVHLLLTHNAQVDAECGWRTTPIERASFRGADGAGSVRALVEGGATQNAHVLSSVGDLDGLTRYLDQHANVLEEERMIGPGLSGTPLHAAVNHHQSEAVSLLLARGAKVNARASVGQTPLHLSSRSLKITQMLVNAGGDTTAIDDEHGTPPLTWAQFFVENLEPGNDEIHRVIEYLTPLPH